MSDLFRRSLRRRQLLKTASMAAFFPSWPWGRLRLASPARALSHVDMLIAGPIGGYLDQWALQIAPALQHALALPQPVRQDAVGGADGLTGANHFEARATPDGASTLMFPGSAALAWLCGDSKVQFDIGGWTPMLVSTAPCVIVGRGNFARLPAGKRVRAAASHPGGPELPMLLALDQLGVAVQPVFGLDSEVAVTQAYADRAVDVLFLRGSHLPEACARLTDSVPLMTLGDSPDASRFFPSAPSFQELKATRNPPAEDLGSALNAVTAASMLEMALVLPQLIPADAMSLWRQAANDLGASLSLASYASSLSERLLAGADAATALKPLQVDSTVQLSLRKWLSTKFNWKP